MSRLTNLRDFQQNDSSNFVLFTESQHCGVFSVQLLPAAQNWVFVNKPSKKLLQNCKVRKFVKTKMKNGHSWGDYNFLLFLPTCLLPQLLFLPMWKPIPKLCHQTRLAKLSQWLIIYGVQFGKWQKVRYETVFNNSIFLVYCHVTKCHQSCRYSHTFCLCRNLRPFWSMGVSRWKCD